MKLKPKKIIAAGFAVLGAVLLISSCRAGAGVSALAVSNTVTLTVPQTVALFGNQIQCEYYATDGTYKQTVATFDGYGANAVGSSNFVDSSGISLDNRQFAYYLMPMPSDYDPSSQSMSILFKTAVDISSLDYFDSALIYSSSIDTSSQLYGTYVGYWYCSDGYHYAARQGASGTAEYNLYGYVRDNSNRQCLCIPCLYQSGSNTTFSTGWANIGGWSALSGTNSVAIGIVCPIISENWVFDGSTGAGAGGSSGGGSESGVSVDLSGVTSRLDDILAKLDSIIANQQNNSNSSGSGSEPSALDTPPASFDAAAAWSAADGAFQNPYGGSSSGGGYDLGLGSASGGGSSSPPPSDPSEVDMGSGLAFVWFLISYIFGTFPWLAGLTTFSLTVGVAVFIIFHGRGSE